MALFGRDYDREYGYGARPRGERSYGTRPLGYDRSYGPGYRGAGYGGMSDYDEDYGHKSRWQTDYGDPYGDRASNTPIRMMRGEFHGYGRDYEAGYDRGFRNVERDRMRPHGAAPMSYDPYENQGRGGYQGNRGNRWGQGQGTDRGWGRGMDRGGRWGAAGGYQGYTENRYDTGWF